MSEQIKIHRRVGSFGSYSIGGLLWRQTHFIEVADVDSLKAFFEKRFSLKFPEGSQECRAAIMRARDGVTIRLACWMSESQWIEFKKVVREPARLRALDTLGMTGTPNWYDLSDAKHLQTASIMDKDGNSLLIQCGDRNGVWNVLLETSRQYNSEKGSVP